MSPLLVLDAHYLCHRAYHTTGGLSHKGAATGVIFGFLKGIEGFKREFMTDRIAFCFEGKNLKRKDIYPTYKAKREIPQEERELRAEFSQQIKRLRREFLPQIGFNNVFCLAGLEADDLMAQIAREQHTEGKVVLVTADQDMFQCLGNNVSIFNPQKNLEITKAAFENKYGITSRAWAIVKALAGCHTDNVKGVPGIGEVRALQYVRGELKGKALDAIECDEGQETIVRNLALVRLPFKGTPSMPIMDDDLSEAGWQSVCRELGMRSLGGRLPRLRKAMTKK